MKMNDPNELKHCLTSSEGFVCEIEDFAKNKTFNNESLKVFKKNITRVLTLISRDKNFLALLNEMNCFEVFLDLFKIDLNLYSNKNNDNEDIRSSLKHEVKYLDNILPDFLKLILNLLKNYDEDMNFIPNLLLEDDKFDEISVNEEFLNKRQTHTKLIISDVNWCLVHYIVYFNNKNENIEDIVKYLTSSESRLKHFYNFIADYKDEVFLKECKFLNLIVIFK